MIKINLCPQEELESPYWYIPDVAVAITVALAGYFAVQYYLGGIQEDIDRRQNEIASLEATTAQLIPEIEKFKNLGADIAKLRSKLGALQEITVSKLERVKAVIVLEHFQNLRPLGLWYQSLSFGTPDNEKFQVRGQAFDNILTAEFMMALRATGSQEYDPSDMRTHVYFDKLELIKAELKLGEVESYPDLKNLPSFEIHGQYVTRKSATEENPKVPAEQEKISQVDSIVPKAG